MACPTSLWQEIQKLIRLRRDHPALCARGGLEFVFCEDHRYPLAYLRTAKTESVLVVLNPSRNPAEFPCPYRPQEVLYQHGDAVEVRGDSLRVPGESAAFLRVETRPE